MITILGPAKTIDTSPHGVTDLHTSPLYLEQATVLVEKLQKYSLARLKKLMKVSDKLATLTFERYATWNPSYSYEEAQQAILAFSGEVFNGLKARSLKEKDLVFAQEHVRILSGLYGVLRPLDMILPYRLEMGTKFPNPRGKNLYDFWKTIIPEKIQEDTRKQETAVLINLASQEYFKSIQPQNFPHRIITPVFKESNGEGYRNVTIYAKKARGLMCDFIIRNHLTDVDAIKFFTVAGYQFNKKISSENEWVYTRGEPDHSRQAKVRKSQIH